MKTVIFDLDSTLADTRHRQWMIPMISASHAAYEALGFQPPKPTWDDYSMACDKDEPIAATIALTGVFANAGHRVIIVTGRSSSARALTEEWLYNHDIQYDDLYMRAAGDRTANPRFKAAVIRDLILDGAEIELVVDDFDAVAEEVHKHWPEIPVLLVNPGYHGEEGA